MKTPLTCQGCSAAKAARSACRDWTYSRLRKRPRSNAKYAATNPTSAAKINNFFFDMGFLARGQSVAPRLPYLTRPTSSA